MEYDNNIKMGQLMSRIYSPVIVDNAVEVQYCSETDDNLEGSCAVDSLPIICKCNYLPYNMNYIGKWMCIPSDYLPLNMWAVFAYIHSAGTSLANLYNLPYCITMYDIHLSLDHQYRRVLYAPHLSYHKLENYISRSLLQKCDTSKDSRFSRVCPNDKSAIYYINTIMYTPFE